MKRFLPAFLLLVVYSGVTFGQNIAKPDLSRIHQYGFIENKGQIVDQNGVPNKEVKFLLNTPGFNVQLRDGGWSYDTYTVTTSGERIGKPGDKKRSDLQVTRNIHRVDINLLNANTDVAMVPDQLAEDKINYIAGNFSGISHYRKVTYVNVYDKIDLVFYQNDKGTFEYDFVVHPGGDANDIRIEYEGQNQLTWNENDALDIFVAGGHFTESIPKSYLLEQNKPLTVAYQAFEENQFGFAAPEYDRQTTLVIDPAPSLIFYTFYGGVDEDQAYTLRYDESAQQMTVGGITYSTTNIASNASFQNASQGFKDGFVARFNSLGNNRQWGTYFGSSSNDVVSAIALDANGNVYAAGVVSDALFGFATAGQTTFGGGVSDAFVARLSAVSGELFWGTYLGGADEDYAVFAELSGGSLFVGGTTLSLDNIAVGTGQYQSSNGGGYDAFVTVHSVATGAIQIGTYIGGTEDDTMGGLYVDGGTVFTAVNAASGGLQTIGQTYSGGSDVLLGKFTAGGLNIISSTYYGGFGNDYAGAIATVNSQYVYLTGYTDSFSGIASVGSHQPDFGGFFDVFLTQLNYSDFSQNWGTYYGGDDDDESGGLQVDLLGNALIGGYTKSQVFGTISSTNLFIGGAYDGFVAKFNNEGIRQWGMYTGGTNDDGVYSLVSDDSGGFWTVGGSNSTDLGIFEGTVWQSTPGGDFDAIITRFASDRPHDQPANMQFSSITDTSMDGSFDFATSATRYLVLRRAFTATSGVPFDGLDYAVGAVIVDGTVVYHDDGNFFSDSGLSAGTTYYYTVYTSNNTGSAVVYNLVTPLVSSQLTTGTGSLASEPFDSPTNLVFTNGVGPGDYSLSWTPPFIAPDGYIVLRNTTQVPPTETPEDGVEYTDGDPLGNAFVATIATGTSANFINGVPEGFRSFAVYAFNGSGTNTNYRTISPATVTGQLLAVEPTDNPTNFVVTNLSTTGFSYTWTQSVDANVQGYVAVRKIGSVPTSQPEDGQVYAANDVLDDGSIIAFSLLKTDNLNRVLSNGTPGNTYNYAVYAYSGSNGSINYKQTFPLTKAVPLPLTDDSTPPVIVDNSPGTVPFGSSVTLSFNVTDADGFVDNVEVTCFEINTDNEITVNMQNTTGNTWTGTISASDISEQGIEYYVNATDDSNNSTDNEDFTQIIVTYSEDGLTIPYNSAGTAKTSYRIVSVPLSLTTKTVKAVFADDLGDEDKSKYRLYRYSGGSTGKNVELSSTSSIELGKGYWFISSTAPKIDSGPGATASAGVGVPLTVPVVKGWNQIGNPFLRDVPWADVQGMSDNDALGVGALRVYKGKWDNGTTLEKFSGGFVMITEAAGNLRIPVINNSRLVTEPPVNFAQSLDNDTWAVPILLSSGDMTNEFAGLGMHPSASEEHDRFDDYTLPRFFDFLELNHRKTLFGANFTKDIVPTQNEYVWDFEVVSNGDDEVIELKWDNTTFGTSDRKLVLWDVAQQIAVDMRTASTYSFNKRESGNFKVFFGGEKFIDESTLPDRLVFHSVSPVPSRENVTFAFSVPDRADQTTTLVVYDLMGRKITSLINDRLGRGYHEAVWKMDEGGKPGPGVYIGVLKFGNSTAQKRLIIE